MACVPRSGVLHFSVSPAGVLPVFCLVEPAEVKRLLAQSSVQLCGVGASQLADNFSRPLLWEGASSKAKGACRKF